MKKKLFLSLLVVVALFTITGCGSKEENKENKENKENEVERESVKYQQGYQEGKYSIGDLTFNLPDGYQLDGTDRYTYRDSSNALIVELYVDDLNGDLREFIKKDTHSFYPTMDALNEINLNGNRWLKGKTIDNTYVYYTKDGNKAYSIMLSPVFTTSGKYSELETTFEKSLYFKI
jgi:hypothetical protein